MKNPAQHNGQTTASRYLAGLRGFFATGLATGLWGTGGLLKNRRAMSSMVKPDGSSLADGSAFAGCFGGRMPEIVPTSGAGVTHAVRVRDRPEVQALTQRLLSRAHSDESREAFKRALDNLDEVFERMEHLFPRKH